MNIAPQDPAPAGASNPLVSPLPNPLPNPLLVPWQTLHGLPPFDRIAPQHFEPAFAEALAEHRAELQGLTQSADAPDFDNTVAALDRSGRLLSRVSAVLHHLNASATNEALQAVQRAMAAPLAAHYSALYQDPALFARLDALHARRDTLGLEADQRRLLERFHLDCVRSGAQLAPAARQRHGEIVQALATLHTQFAQNVLHDESTWRLPLQDEADLAGLPPFARAAAAQAAQERGLSGHVLVLARSLVMAFLSFSTRRDLREQVWRAWDSRGAHPGERDNRPLIRDILRLRHELAGLHGCACYADYALADTMAGSRAAVAGLLDDVWPRALAAVSRERDELQAVMQAAGVDEPLQTWDWRYWAEQVRQQRYALDDADIKPYFALPQVVAAAFDCAARLFGLRFEVRPEIPVYHPDVCAYEVFAADDRLVGVFLQDNYARPNKRSGAWMSALRLQSRDPAGAERLPIIVNNNNFVRGGNASSGDPTLLSLDDARTLFHEFGHGLHGLLSDVRFERLSGTQVLRDFVELPSQLFEHWLTEPEVLRRHARHWRTGEPIPDGLIERLHRARRFNQGFETVRYCASALVDMAVHSRTDPEPPADVCAFEAAELQARGLPPGVGQNHRLVHFQHLFSSSAYAAGYYVYLWAEVLDADGYQAFVEAGNPFDAAVAQRLLRHIYSSGNSVEPRAAYLAFRGRPATVQPLLLKRGLVPEAAAEPA